MRDLTPYVQSLFLRGNILAYIGKTYDKRNENQTEY